MSIPAYITMEGNTQGLITRDVFTADSVGNIYVEGHENEILAQAISHQVMIPTDPQSGQPSGQRVHKPFVFTCSMNKAVPLMYQALVTGEILPLTVVRWYRHSAGGKKEHFFTTELVDGIIVDINLVLPNSQDKANEIYTQLVEVSMSYRQISWEHKISGTAAIDDWRRPVETAA